MPHISRMSSRMSVPPPATHLPPQVRLSPKVGKAILISGHDIQDTYDLLLQTEGKGEQQGFVGAAEVDG